MAPGDETGGAKSGKQRADGSYVHAASRESERPPLVWPGHRKMNETLETVAARQASLNSGLDQASGAGRRATASSGSNVRSCTLATRANSKV